MKLKTTVIAAAVLSLTSITATQAAVELTPKQATELKPYERITVTGRFNAIYEASDAVSRRADKMGAYAFYIQSLDDVGDSGNMRVVADVYAKDAPEVGTPKRRVFGGVEEMSKTDATEYEPFDTVTVSGFYPSQPDLYEAIAKKALEKNAASFYVVRNIAMNDGGNTLATAYIYKKDAPKRQVLNEDAVVPADSEAGRALLAEGGEAAKKVRIPGVASSEEPTSAVGRFFETSSSQPGRTGVTLPSGYVIEEVNKTAAAQMVPFDSITFSGYYTNTPEVRYQIAKRAEAKGAKYFHITREWQSNGGSVTISADLFK
ncbi:DUF1471 family protein YdgH [Providencia rettgeri]